MDAVVDAAFPNIRHLLKIYTVIPHSEAVAEPMFYKMDPTMTKKQYSSEDESLDMLMRIFLMIFDRVFENLEVQKQLLCF